MKTKVLFTLLTIAAVSFMMGCDWSPFGGEKEHGGWQSKISGSYKSEIFTGDTKFIGKTTFKGSGGTYELDDNGTKVTGTLTKITADGDRKLKCRWKDTNGEGNFTLTFSDDLSSFKGQWDNDDAGASGAWNGKK
jgi:hypothetical protein